ncbi:putative UDP-3-O-acyl-N-acetylglucosamine deacetylase 5 [Chlorella vulgaris]
MPATHPRAPAFAVQPADYQQTLRRSFAVGGIGLHTGEYALVRVLPAFAGDGRYFVRCLPGTNSHHWELEQPRTHKLPESGTPATHGAAGGEADLNSKLFFEYIQGQEDGSFAGSFAAYLQQRASLLPDTLFIDAETDLLPEEQPICGHPGEDRMQAHVSNLQPGHEWCTVLAQGDEAIWGAEHLLAALECCGVDNARIEIEGGQGESLAMYALEQQWHPHRFGGCADFGIDCTVSAPVIGRQWFTWNSEDVGSHGKGHFRVALAPARTWYTSVQSVQSLMAEGLLQGGPDYASLIGDGNDWLDSSMVRFPSDEAARHAVVDLLGDLSLLASPGGRGLPAGHIVAFQPTHRLQAEFVQTLQMALVDKKS